jgi:hypothetical protein
MAVEGSEQDMRRLEEYNNVVPFSKFAGIRKKFDLARRRIDIEQYTNEARAGDKFAYLKLKELHEKSAIINFEETRGLYEKARSEMDNA